MAVGKLYRNDINKATEKAAVAIYIAVVATQYIAQLWKRPHGSGIIYIYIVYKEKI